jgi:signal transduction histidine kinase/CheY-like chemotaxis protein
MPTAAFENVDLGDDGPFSDIEGIVYASDTEDPKMRVLAATEAQSLTGEVYRHEFEIGTDAWLIVARAKAPLAGSFAANVHWVLLGAGLLAAVLLAALVETLSRRRLYALALVAERTSELEAAEQGHRLAREEAEAANRAKDEFISRMSHELRTPLNAVLGFAQLLELDDLSPEQADSVQHIVKGGRHLLGLINEILDISRINAGSLSLSPEPVAVDELVGETLSLLAPVAASRNIDLQHDRGDPDLADLFVEADRQRAKQILLNLIANAVKYNVDSGSVRVSAQRAGDAVRITVADTGTGIAGNDIDKVFVAFERLGVERTGIEGAGIGLALSLRLAEAMGGTIVAESEVGTGSRFTLVLPGADNPLAAMGPEASGDVAAVGSGGTAPQRHTVLYIEDNLSNVRLVERIVARRNDVDLLPAMQGQLGIELAREHTPDLILLDLHLPDIDGDEVLRQLRRDPVTSAIPVCMVSADATPRQMERLIAEGANRYVTKPIDVQELLAVLSEVLDAPATV